MRSIAVTRYLVENSFDGLGYSKVNVINTNFTYHVNMFVNKVLNIKSVVAKSKISSSVREQKKNIIIMVSIVHASIFNVTPMHEPPPP